MILDADAFRQNLADDWEGPTLSEEVELVYALPPLDIPGRPPVDVDALCEQYGITDADVAMLADVATHWHFPSLATPERIRAVASFIEALLKEFSHEPD